MNRLPHWFALLLCLIATSSAIASQPSKIKPGDKLKLTVTEEPAINREYQVTPKGLILVSYLGAVKVEGLTADEAAKRVSERLVSEKIVGHATVSLEPVTPVKQAIKYQGAVEEPGELTFQEGMTLADVIRQAGITPETDLNTVTVEHADGKTDKVDFTKFDPRTGQGNVILKAGDTVVFGKKADPTLPPTSPTPSKPSIDVKGEVANAGSFSAEVGMTVKDLIERAGGLSTKATAISASLVRSGETRILSLPADNLVLLLPGDFVTITPQSQVFSVIVAGLVARPGPIQVDETVRLSELVSRAGGLMKGAGDSVLISPPASTGTAYVVSLRKVAEGYTSNPVLEPGTRIEFLKDQATIAKPNRTATVVLGIFLLWLLFKR